MKLIKSINLMEDKKLIRNLNIAAIGLILVFFPLFGLLAYFFAQPTSDLVSFGMSDIIWSIIWIFGLLVIHELIHGIFFKVFHPEGKVKYGFKNGMAYATSPNSFYPKWKFAWICLAPFTLITLALFIIYVLGGISAYVFVYLAALHASGCVGDFYWMYLIIKAPEEAYVEDTEIGINFYVMKKE